MKRADADAWDLASSVGATATMVAAARALVSRNSVVDYLGQRGWDVSARSHPEVFAGYGRPFRAGVAMDSMRNSLSVIAIRKDVAQ